MEEFAIVLVLESDTATISKERVAVRIVKARDGNECWFGVTSPYL